MAFGRVVIAWLLLAGSLCAQPMRGTYIDVLFDGADEIRTADTPKLLDAGFNLFASTIRGQAATDPNSIDAKWLDTLKAGNAKAIVIPNVLTPAQYKTVAEKWPDVVIGYHLQDDANYKTPAEITAAYNAVKPFLAGTTAYITVAKNTRHADYGGLVPWYHVQCYLGKAVTAGDGFKQYAYDGTLAARAAVPATGKLFGAGYLGKNPTPYFGRRDPVWQANDFASPYVQEAALWLQLMGGADHLLSYTAYSIAPTFPASESRIAERWDLLPGWKLINARIKSLERFFVGGTRTTRVDGKSCIGEWKLPSGETLIVTVDLTSEFYPRTDWEIKTPVPATVTTLKVTSTGEIKVEKLP
jgi:hypothetical protein